MSERPLPVEIAAYIEAAPAAGRAHLRRLHALLREAAPQATETIKWGTPFFVEPRFLFAYSAHKTHCSFAPVAAALEQLRGELQGVEATKGLLRLPYARPLPEALIRRLAELSLRLTRERVDTGFW